MADNEFEGYVKAKLEDGGQRLERIEDKIDEQNGRTRKNEVKISYIFGALAVLGIAITLVRFL